MFKIEGTPDHQQVFLYKKRIPSAKNRGTKIRRQIDHFGPHFTTYRKMQEAPQIFTVDA
jgi:hypothetical protein